MEKTVLFEEGIQLRTADPRRSFVEIGSVSTGDARIPQTCMKESKQHSRYVFEGGYFTQYPPSTLLKLNHRLVMWSFHAYIEMSPWEIILKAQT